MKQPTDKKADIAPRYLYVHEYLTLCRKAFKITGRGGTVKLTWSGTQLDQVKWRQEFWDALDRRINSKGGLKPVGRKFSEMYQVDLLRDRNDLVNILRYRIRVYQFRTPDVRKRLDYLLSSYSDA